MIHIVKNFNATLLFLFDDNSDIDTYFYSANSYLQTLSMLKAELIL